MKTLLFLMVLCVTKLQAEQVDKLSDTLPYVDEKTTVIVDVYNTLIRPEQQLGTHKWGAYLYQKFIDEGMSPEEAQREACRRVYYVVRMSNMLPVEPNTATTIRELQDAGVTVFALTGAPADLSNVLPNQLLASSIDMTRTAPVTEDFELDMAYGAKFENGILYAAGNDKGEALKTFFSLSGGRPERVVYIGDQQQEVDSVKSTLDKLGIESVAIRYDGGEHSETSIEPEVVELQWELLGKILSDEQARTLLKKNETPPNSKSHFSRCRRYRR